MTSSFDNEKSKRVSIFLIVIIIIVLLVISFLVGGADGLFGILKFFFVSAFIISFLSFVFYVVWYIFFKSHPRNIPYENWKSYLKSALDNGSDMMDSLILTGDKHHSAKRFMQIKGYLRVMGFNNIEYDMFIGKRGGNPFEDYKIVMLEPEQHTDLIGDVYVKGISLIMKYGFYFLNTDMIDFRAIDENVAKDTFRTLMYETLGDMKGILDRATGLDPDYIKQRQQDKLLKIPILSGQQGNQGGSGGST